MMMKTLQTNRHIMSEITQEYKLKVDLFPFSQADASPEEDGARADGGRRAAATHSVRTRRAEGTGDGGNLDLLIPWWQNPSGSNVDNRFLGFPKSSEGKEPKLLERGGLCKLKGGNSW